MTEHQGPELGSPGTYSGFGFSEALRSAQAALDGGKELLARYEQTKTANADVPLSFDSRSLSVLAYKSAIERVRERFWTTTFLGSEFWSGNDSEILRANIQMMASRGQTDLSVLRLFLLPLPAEEEIQRLQDERILLRKCEDFDGLERFDQRIATLVENIKQLSQHGCDVRVIHYPDQQPGRLPAELNLNPRDTEIAIYDDWRFDLFPGGLTGTIRGIRGYTPIMTRFTAYRDAVVDFFQQLWKIAKPIEVFLAQLQKALEYSSMRIDYHTGWLARYDHALPREDEALKVEELSSVRTILTHLGRWGNLNGLLDVGTCTGRYPISLRNAVRAGGLILGVDNDIDCVRFTQAKVRHELKNDHRLRIERHDFCTPELPSDQSFDLITCMLGTICHFERQATEGSPYADAFQGALNKFARLLTRNGVLFFSVWTEEACQSLRLLSNYSEEDKQRLAKTAIPRDELIQRLAAAGLLVSAPICLQDRMELYRCERIQ